MEEKLTKAEAEAGKNKRSLRCVIVFLAMVVILLIVSVVFVGIQSGQIEELEAQVQVSSATSSILPVTGVAVDRTEEEESDEIDANDDTGT